MSVLGRSIANNAVKMNKEIVEGYTYHDLKNGITYIDRSIRHVSEKRTMTNLKYIGCRPMFPEEIVAWKFKQGNNNRMFNLAPNDLYFVEYLFDYNGEEIKVVVALPFIEKGNKFLMGGKSWTILPTIMDKVISVGANQVFIDMGLAKYTFVRDQHTIIENNQIRNIGVVLAVLYTKTSGRLPPTTGAKPTMMHYLLAQYGYSKTMEMLLGFVPEVVTGVKDIKGKTVFQSSGKAPSGYFLKAKERFDVNKGKLSPQELMYNPNPLMFVVPDELNTPELTYVLGNVLYILDHFPGELTIDMFDDPIAWRAYMGIIIHSGNHTIAHLLNNMEVHFEGCDFPFEEEVIEGLEENGIKANNLFDLMVTIFKNFNAWVAQGDNGTFYNFKRIAAKPQVLSTIKFMFNKLYLDLHKEEKKGPIATEAVKKLITRSIRPMSILGIKKEKLFVQITEDSTCHLWFKGTAFINKQESNSVNKTTGSNTSLRHKLNASMITVGNLTYLSKRNPDICIRVNTYITLNPVDGTILPDPVYGDIIERTDKMLRQTHTTTRIVDINDENDMDLENDDDRFDADMFDGELDGSEDEYD